MPPTIAVLPFVNLSTDEEQEFFADGITEDTISYFSKSKTFPIISLNSVMKYKIKNQFLLIQLQNQVLYYR